MFCQNGTRYWEFHIISAKAGPYLKIIENYGLVNGMGNEQQIETLNVEPVIFTIDNKSNYCTFEITRTKRDENRIRFCLSTLTRESTAQYDHVYLNSPKGSQTITCTPDNGFEDAIKPFLKSPLAISKASSPRSNSPVGIAR